MRSLASSLLAARVRALGRAGGTCLARTDGSRELAAISPLRLGGILPVVGSH